MSDSIGLPKSGTAIDWAWTAIRATLLLAALTWGCGPDPGASEQGFRGWRVRGGDPGGLHYSALNQIHRGNVARLQPAWSFDTGDAFEGSEMQCNPIVIGDVLYATTPRLRVIALEAATGRLLWSFDPRTVEEMAPGKNRNRGVAYWGDASEGRVLFTAGHFLFSLDAATGGLDPAFGRSGRVDLRQGLDRDPEHVFIRATSPGSVFQDLLILGSLVNETLPSAPGDIRAYDVRTGEIRWSFHTIPRPGEPGHETWPSNAYIFAGGANAWAGMTLDSARGLVFCPTGSAAFDFYGGNRIGDNLFANTLLALDATTGRRVWHFQGVRHDVWDRDFPAPPTLVSIRRGGRRVDAVAQTTKSGHVFLLERETGKPLFPIEERPAPASELEGEVLSEFQPIPVKPPPFARQRLTEEIVTNRTPEARQAVLAELRNLRSGGQFTPPSLEGTVIFPGFDGGAEWGGSAFDPETGLLYVNSNEMAWVLRMLKRPATQPPVDARSLYLRDCAPCHGSRREGSPPDIPALLNLAEGYSLDETALLIREGAGRMPGFPQLAHAAAAALSDHLLTGSNPRIDAAWLGPAPQQVAYTHAGYVKLLDPDGYPAVEPPWGTLNAIDLNRGEIRWTVPLGEFPELARQGLRDTGTENYGGPVVTAGGLVFIGATNHDNKFRAFDKETGELLWEAHLPAAGNATPAIYEADGSEYVVIAAGGGKSGRPSGGSYVAFALPD